MKRTYEAELPAGYTETKIIDAKNTKLAVILNVIALIITVAVITIAYFIIRPKESYFSSISNSRNIIFIIILLAYIILHELVHGAAYKLLTKQKLKFGLTLSVAYCGVPDIYVYRRAALIALLAPLIVFLFIFGLPVFIFADSWDKIYASALLGLHIGGCSGDIYDTLLYLFKFRSNDTLMRDTGPKQIFYTKISEQ